MNIILALPNLEALIKRTQKQKKRHYSNKDFHEFYLRLQVMAEFNLLPLTN